MRSEKTKQLLSLIAYGCFLAGIVIETLLVVVDKSAYTIPAEGQIFRLTFVLFLVKVLLTRYTKREYAAIFLLCILGELSYFATGRNEVLRLVIMIAACKDMDMRRTFKLIFGITLSGCALIMFLALTGIYGTVSLTQEYGRGVTETRYTLGMGHPNALHCMVFCLILLGIYLYGRSMKWFHYLFLILVNYGFFRLTGSRTSFLITTATILYAMLLLYLKQEVLKKLLIFGGYLAAACSVLLSVVIAGNAYRVYDYVWNADRTPVTMIFVKLNELYHDRAHKDAAIADGSQQIFLTAVKVGTCGHFLEVFARQELCRIIAQAPAFMFKHIPSIDNIFFPPFLLEKLTDLIFGLT